MRPFEFVNVFLQMKKMKKFKCNQQNINICKPCCDAVAASYSTQCISSVPGPAPAGETLNLRLEVVFSNSWEPKLSWPSSEPGPS
jgi:hypothetical protein